MTDSWVQGTLEDPIMVRSFGDENYVGCTGWPKDSHGIMWNVISRKRPVERCTLCGNVFKMDYVGPENKPCKFGFMNPFHFHAANNR